MSRRERWLLGGGFVLLAAVVALGMISLRSSTLRALDSPEAKARWQEWRDEAARLSQTGPVLRRPLKSGEPPALILMRDHFPALLAGAIFFSSVFYLLLAWLIRGSMRSRHNLVNSSIGTAQPLHARSRFHSD